MIDKHDTADVAPALIKIFWVWLWVGVSQMTPLQAVQFIAGIIAIVYTAVNLFVLVRDKIVNHRRKEVP